MAPKKEKNVKWTSCFNTFYLTYIINNINFDYNTNYKKKKKNKRDFFLKNLNKILKHNQMLNDRLWSLEVK